MCSKDKNLIRSHIIPESFYRAAYPNNNGIMVSKDNYSKRFPIGIYDKEIVCEECEKIFSSWDDYGNKFFAETLLAPQKSITKNSIDVALIISDVRHVELKLFLMSVLWRAAICNQDFFDGIVLGPFENNLREKILNSSPGNDDDFSIFISKFNTLKTDVLQPPHKARLGNGVNGYKIYFFNAEIFIKVDKRPMGVYTSLILSPRQLLVVSLKEPPEVIRLLNKVPH